QLRSDQRAYGHQLQQSQSPCRHQLQLPRARNRQPRRRERVFHRSHVRHSGREPGLQQVGKRNLPMKNAYFAVSAGLSLLAVLISTNALAAAGRTPGAFGVSQSGSATYSIPIWAPPGPNGLQPHIPLVYDSRGGGGSEGMGWSVAGLSSIYLCNQTIAQDGVAAPVGLASKRFCMDGKRLRLTSSDNLSTYGQDGTTYQTE